LNKKIIVCNEYIHFNNIISDKRNMFKKIHNFFTSPFIYSVELNMKWLGPFFKKKIHEINKDKLWDSFEFHFIPTS
jgi:hypothetical protein